jgi:tight adherence protein B
VFIYLMIFFGAFERVRQIVGSHAGEIRHKNRRMRMIVQGEDEDEDEDETRIAEVLFRNHSTRSARTKGPVESFQRIVAHANLPIGMRALIACLISFAVVIFLAAFQFVMAPAAAVTALLLEFGLPYAIFNRMAEARLKTLSEQLPDALDMMARGLRVGHPLNVTMRRVFDDAGPDRQRIRHHRRPYSPQR